MPDAPGPELNIVLLEERTRDGWAGHAAVTCPCGCGVETVYTVTSSLGGRGIGFWAEPDGRYSADRSSIRTGGKR